MHKPVCHKGKTKFENYKNCLEATQLEYKTDFLKNNKLILQTQQLLLSSNSIDTYVCGVSKNVASEKDIYKNIEEYNPDKKRKIQIVFGDMIADMDNNEIVTELFI